MAFVEQRFPTDIRPKQVGGPRYKTIIKQLRGGGEHRNSLWANPLRRYSVTLGPRDTDAIEAYLDFIATMHGPLHVFRLKDWSDFSATGETIGTGNGTARAFALTKAYGSYSRRIFKPVANSITVYVDGVAAAVSSVNLANGYVVLASAPAANAVVTADFEFDVPVRFEDDDFDLTMIHHSMGGAESITLVEVRIRDEMNAVTHDAEIVTHDTEIVTHS